MNVIAGVAWRFNQKDEPVRLTGMKEYPRKLRWVSKQAIVLFDTLERRSWLVDGASALLHLVRSSLQRDEDDSLSPYEEWLFDAAKLQDSWPGCSSLQAAMKTLKNTGNLNLKLYSLGRDTNDDQAVEKFSTFRDRVLEILHSLEILVDTQKGILEKGDIRISQTMDRHKSLTGYDVLDVIEPAGRINSRIARFTTQGDGWVEMLPSFHAVTLFGQGYGNLIRPRDATSLCSRWATVPMRKDYLCVMVVTLKMLHEEMIQRHGSTSNLGELTSKLTWTSRCPPFSTCECITAPLANVQEHIDPRQFLVSCKQSLTAPVKPKASACVNLANLDNAGAVVFANCGRFNRPTEDDHVQEHDEDVYSHLSPLPSDLSQSIGSISATASDNTQTTSTDDTSITIDSSTITPAALHSTTSSVSSPSRAVLVTSQVQNRDKGKGKAISKMKRLKELFR